MTAKGKWTMEYTDTFGGEANYSWVRRGEFPGHLTELQVMRRAKAACGISGLRGRTERYGDQIAFTPYRYCTRLFLHYA